MTNTDFWKNIDTIIAQGFNTRGLKQLEKYAELFISGRLVYQRFSPLEQHGCTAGGSNHVIASLLAGASIDPSSLSAPEGSFQRERECAETQAKHIEQWAKTVGCWMDDVDKSLPSLRLGCPPCSAVLSVTDCLLYPACLGTRSHQSPQCLFP